MTKIERKQKAQELLKRFFNANHEAKLRPKVQADEALAANEALAEFLVEITQERATKDKPTC